MLMPEALRLLTLVHFRIKDAIENVIIFAVIGLLSASPD